MKLNVYYFEYNSGVVLIAASSISDAVKILEKCIGEDEKVLYRSRIDCEYNTENPDHKNGLVLLDRRSWKDKNIYCFEVITGDGHKNRFSLSKKNYEELLKSEYKVKWVTDYYDNRIKITKFLRSFVTQNKNISIGCIDGTHWEF